LIRYCLRLNDNADGCIQSDICIYRSQELLPYLLTTFLLGDAYQQRHEQCSPVVIRGIVKNDAWMPWRRIPFDEALQVWDGFAIIGSQSTSHAKKEAVFSFVHKRITQPRQHIATTDWRLLQGGRSKEANIRVGRLELPDEVWDCGFRVPTKFSNNGGDIAR